MRPRQRLTLCYTQSACCCRPCAVQWLGLASCLALFLFSRPKKDNNNYLNNDTAICWPFHSIGFLSKIFFQCVAVLSKLFYLARPDQWGTHMNSWLLFGTCPRSSTATNNKSTKVILVAQFNASRNASSILECFSCLVWGRTNLNFVPLFGFVGSFSTVWTKWKEWELFCSSS